MADLKLTVDISALTAAEAKVKSMTGKIIPIKFSVTGLEGLKGIDKAFGGSAMTMARTTASVNNLGTAMKKIAVTGAGGIVGNVARTTADVNNLGTAMRRVTTINSDGSTKSSERYNTELGKTVEIIEKIDKSGNKLNSTRETQINTDKKELDNFGKRQTALENIDKIRTRNLAKYVDQGAMSGLEKQVGALDPKSKNFESGLAKAGQAVKGYKHEAESAKYAQDQLTRANKENLLSVDNIKTSMKTAAVRTVEWAVTMGVLYGAVNAVKSMVSTSTAIADQMNSIKMVTGSSDEQIKKMQGTYQNIATELSSTTSEVAKSAEVWLRQGRSIADTNQLIKTSTVLSKVGFMDSATSAQMLTSAINGYGIAAEDAMSVVDKMSAIDVAAATSTQDLALAMSQTAAGAKIAGVSVDQLLSYIATISEVTQASGETVGQSLKTIFARISQVKLGKLTDGEGEDISRVQSVLRDYNIDLVDAQGNFRETGTVLDELAGKWKGLEAAQKSEIAEQFAGIRQKEKFLVLMENYDKALELQAVSMNSAGSAMKKMSIWEESTEAATQRLSNQWEILSSKMVDSNFTKAIINLGALSLSALSSDVGQLTLKLGMLTGVVLALNMAKNKVSSGWGAIDAVGGKGLLSSIKAITLAQSQYKGAVAGSAAAQTVFAEGTFAATVAAQGLKKAVATTGGALMSGTVFPILAAVGAGLLIGKALDLMIVSYDDHIDSIEKSQGKIAENSNEIDAATTKLEQISARIKEINTLKADGRATQDDLFELSHLEATTTQLDLKVDALKRINEQEAKSMSKEAVGALGKTTDVYRGYDTGILDKKPLLPIYDTVEPTTDIGMVKHQIDDIQKLRGEYTQLAADKKAGMSDEDYLSSIQKLDEAQMDLVNSASEKYATVSELMSLITPGESEAGDALLEQFKSLQKDWEEIGRITGSIKPVLPTSSENAQQFGGATAEDFSFLAESIGQIEQGLASGLTETNAFKAGLNTLFSDINPPDDLAAGLEGLKTLFSESEEYAGKFLETVNGYQTASGGFDLLALQNDFNLSDVAIASVNARLEQMGMLMSTSATDGTSNLGNGLGLATETAVGFEMTLGRLLQSIDDGNATFGEAESYIRDYLGQLGVMPGKIEQVVDNFSMLAEGASEFNLLAFTGLTGEGELAGITASIEATASGYVAGFRESIASQLESGADFREINMGAGFGVSFDSLQENIAGQLRDTGLFTDDVITQISNTIAQNTIAANVNVVADATISELNIDNADAQSQISTILQENFNTTTNQFDIPKVVAAVKEIEIEGVDSDGIAANVEDVLLDVNAEIAVTADTSPAEGAMEGIADPADKELSVDADTAPANAAIDAIPDPPDKSTTVTANTGQATGALGSVIGLLSSIYDKTVTVTVRNVVQNVVEKITSAVGGSATGRINVDTSQFGKESLVGEEGEEALLRKGNLSFIGTHGAEIIPIQDGDTILPADVTRRIKSGDIPMYAKGKYSVSANNKGIYGADVWGFRDTSSIWSGLATDPPEDEGAKKAYENHKKAFQKEYDYIQHLKDMEELSDKDYYARLNDLNTKFFKNKNEYLDEYRKHEEAVYKFLKEQEKDRLSDLKKNYGSATSAVGKIIDRQIEEIRSTNSLEEAYKAVKDAKESVDNLTGQKTVRTYVEGLGWQWESDKNALKDAQKGLEDAQKDYDIAVLEDYKSKWESITDNYENEQDNLIAKQILGADYEQAILDGRLDILTNFANKYSEVLSSLSKIEGEESPILKYDDSSWSLSDMLTEKKLSETGSLKTSNLAGAASSSVASNLSALANMTSIVTPSSTSSNTYLNIANINLENVTDFDSFLTEATQYGKIHSPKK